MNPAPPVPPARNRPRDRRWRGLLAAVLGAALIATALTAIDAAAPAIAAAPATLAGHWTFDENSGSTAADTAGAHNATLVGGAGWGAGVQGPALTTNGSTGYADTGAAVLDATRSFSVNAWVKLGRVTGYQTVLSIDGDQVSNFFLQFRDDTRRFAFVRLPADQAAGAPAFPSATFDPVAAQWYMLTGVYDSTADTLSLYVDGQLAGTTAAPPAWAPSGHLVIGRGKFGGNPTDWVSGSIDDVRAYSAALAPAQVAQLATFGSWRMDEGTGTTVADSSVDPHDGTLSGGTSWTAGAVGAHAVKFDGASGVATIPATVLDTTQSFSVAAWVRVDSASGFRTAVSVDGNAVSGFFLQRRSDGRFAFTRLASDGTAAAAAVAESTEVAQVGQWYQLVGVYDSVARTVTLYVDGTAQQSVPFSTPWRATGQLVIGRGQFGAAPVDFFDGAISDVRSYPFPLAAAGAQALATTGIWHFDEGTGTVAADSSPLGAPGTLRGDASWVAGAANSAVGLAGHGDVTMGETPALSLGAGPLSIAAWLRTSSTAVQPVVEKGAATAAESGYRLGVDGGRLTARVGGGAGRIEVSTVAASYADGGWHHVALVLDRTAAVLTLYVDGRPAPITAAAGSCGTAGGSSLDVTGCAGASADSAEPFTVGSTSGTAPWLTGAVDELEVTRYPLTAAQVALLAGSNDLVVNATDVRAVTDTNQYGGMLEDISHSVDGGLYAELVRNRSFAESYQAGSGPGNGPVPYWSLAPAGGATGSFAVDTSTPLNSAITRSLKVTVDSLPAGGSLAAANVGYYGVSVTPNTSYTGSLWAKATSGFTGTARVSLVAADGTVLASSSIGRLGTSWHQHPYTLRTPKGIATSTDNRIVVTLANSCAQCATIGAASVWLSVVSLFPPTYQGRANGLRPDIMRKLAAMHIGQLRIPGGNYLEGNTLDTRFNWKNTIGPISARPGHQNTAWGYWSTDGMGLLEYLEMAQDIGAQPMLAVFAGYTLNGQHVAEADFGPYVQDALDEIEYAIGPTTSTWGAKRAAAGHPAPFDLHYVEVGNEDQFDSSGSYSWRFADLFDAIRARYPQMQIVATTAVTSRTPDVLDEHFYQPPSWFASNSTMFDTADRNGPRILVGEYGAQEGNPTGSLAAAVGEAAFLTGLERASDIVLGSMFAPMIVNENQSNWPVNMIGIDAAGSYGSPSYWVQDMFSNNLGAHVLGTSLTAGSALREDVTASTGHGGTTFYVKVVNPSAQLQSAQLTINGVGRLGSTLTQTVLTGAPAARNTLTAPNTITPVTTQLTGVHNGHRFNFPPNSVTVLKITGH